MRNYRIVIIVLSVLVITVVFIVYSQPNRSCEDFTDADGIPGYTSGDGSWTSDCYRAVCEDMLGADGVANFTENDTLLAASC